jgi:hypothetical protein
LEFFNLHICDGLADDTVFVPGPVVVQPPSEDRVSIFMSLTGGKQASLKIFSTGKVRCLKSDFSSLEHAQGCAQAVIDRMAGINNSGMPPIRLHDAKVRFLSTTHIFFDFDPDTGSLPLFLFDNKASKCVL